MICITGFIWIKIKLYALPIKFYDNLVPCNTVEDIKMIKVLLVNFAIFIYPVLSALKEGFEPTLQHFPPCRQSEGLVRNPIQCDSYYECDNSRLIPKMCPPRQHFRVSEKKCVDDFKKPCQNAAVIYGCPFQWRGLGDKCFIVSQPSTFMGHVYACRKLQNSRLAEIRSHDQLKYVGMWLEETYGNFYQNFFLNIAFSTQKDGWVYQTDYSFVPYDMFNEVDIKRPGYDCAVLALHLNTTLKPSYCTDNYPAICETDPKVL